MHAIEAILIQTILVHSVYKILTSIQKDKLNKQPLIAIIIHFTRQKLHKKRKNCVKDNSNGQRKTFTAQCSKMSKETIPKKKGRVKKLSV